MLQIGDEVTWFRQVGGNFRTLEKLPGRVLKLGREKATILVLFPDQERRAIVSYENLEKNGGAA